MRTILAPGIEIKEIDKSGYSPAMTGTGCLVPGFTDRGEPYLPMEFTSRAAWISYYGDPKNEAERYAYAAACEVLNQGGRLFFSRLPYDNTAFEKVVGFKYTLVDKPSIEYHPEDETKHTPFWEIQKADGTISTVTAIEPAQAACLYDLSAIDEYRTDEAKVATDTFMIADIAFNTYDKVPEDTRKNEKREMIGIMPVITTAANGMLAQSLIDVDKSCVIGYETIGKVKTLNAAMQLSADYPALSILVDNEIPAADMARLLNTKEYYQKVDKLNLRAISATGNLTEQEVATDISVVSKISSMLSGNSRYVDGSWNGSYQISSYPAAITSDTAISVATFSFMQLYDESQCSSDPAVSGDYKAQDWHTTRFGYHNPDGDDAIPKTVSQEANSMFPTIGFDGEKFERDNLKKIGVVVYKMFLDPSEGNKINFEAVEAYAGSLCKTDKDPNTGVTTFIDTIINSQSKYINFFSNCFNTQAGKKYYADKLDMLVVQPGTARPSKVKFSIDYVKDFQPALEILAAREGITIGESQTVGDITTNTDILDEIIRKVSSQSESLGEAKDKLNALKQLANSSSAKDTVCPSMGFFSEMTKKDISISKSIYDGLNKVFEKNQDILERQIDIVPDAGVANIASYLKAIYGDRGQYDLAVTDDIGNSLLSLWKCDSNNTAIKTWKTVEQKFDNFCKNIRKDCMFIADGPRPLVLAGQKKIIRQSKPANTIDVNIIPNIKWVTGLNTSYGAMYVDWFEQADDYSGDFFWCPPSIKAMGVYINTDVNYNYWDAPAGLNRGVIAATDVAFSPTIKQAGCFYEKNLNYAIQYPNDGIVLEGQKTLQAKPSAFDRVNVRRLFLRLERQSFIVSRYFVYEGNTAYLRQRLIDALDPYFKDAKNNGGIYDYKIKCDEKNNPPEFIDRNELHVSIGIKPVKTAEFILIDFIALSTGGSWEEAGF